MTARQPHGVHAATKSVIRQTGKLTPTAQEIAHPSNVVITNALRVKHQPVVQETARQHAAMVHAAQAKHVITLLPVAAPATPVTLQPVNKTAVTAVGASIVAIAMPLKVKRAPLALKTAVFAVVINILTLVKLVVIAPLT